VYIEHHINLNLTIKEPNELDEVTQYFTTVIQEGVWYWLIYNKLRRNLHDALTNAKNKTFEYYIASLSKDDHTIWKTTRKFKRP
jgi:hypothetical protein